jgi:hypothetical protein
MFPQASPAPCLTYTQGVPLFATSAHAVPLSFSVSPQTRAQDSPVRRPAPSSDTARVPPYTRLPGPTRGGHGDLFTPSHLLTPTARAHPSLVEHSVLSTHSAASTGATAASRIGVRDVAELVWQLAESRYTARQLQQRMHQLETSTAPESLPEKPTEASTSKHPTAEVGDKVDDLKLHRTPPPQSLRDSAHSSTPAGVQQPKQPCREPRRHPSSHQPRKPASRKRATAAPISSSASERGEEDSPFSRSDISSCSSSSSLTSTSTFLSTSAPSSTAASSSSSLSSSAAAARHRRPGSAKQGGRLCYRRAHSAYNRRDNGKSQQAKKKTTTTTSSRRNGGRSASAVVTSSHRRASRHMEGEGPRHRRHPSAASHQHEAETIDTAKATRSLGKNAMSTSRTQRHGHTRHHSAKSLFSPPPPQTEAKHQHHHHRHRAVRDATSLSERRKLHQEAKELRRAREWQRRYYDLMSKYTDETAQRAAELADIHDLIEYMSWEQDHAHRLHTTHISTATAAVAITDADERPDEVTEGCRTAVVVRAKTPTKQETREASPRHLSSTSPPPPPLPSTVEAAGTVSISSHGDGRGASSLTRNQTHEAALPRPPQRVVGPPQFGAADNHSRRRTGDASSDKVEEKEKKEASTDIPHRVDGDLEVDPANPSCGATSHAALQEAAAGSRSPAVVAAYMQALHSEAEMWRQRCLELLERPSEVPLAALKPTLPASAEVSQMELLMPEVPPPLPPRPPQRAPHFNRSDHPTAYQPIDLAASSIGSATPRGWEAEAQSKQGKVVQHRVEGHLYANTESAGSETSPSTVDSSIPPMLSGLPSSRPPLQQHQRQHQSLPPPAPHRAAVHDGICANATDSPSSLLTSSRALSRGLFIANARPPSMTAQPPPPHHHEHRYAPPAPSARPMVAVVPRAAEEHRGAPAASAAAMHALYLATEQRHVDMSPLSSTGGHSPQRPPLFVGLSGYRPADQGWYTPMRWAGAEAAPPSPTHPQQHRSTLEARTAIASVGASQSYSHPHATPPRETLAEGYDDNADRRSASGAAVVGRGVALPAEQYATSLSTTERRDVAQRQRPQQPSSQQLAPPPPCPSHPPAMATAWAGAAPSSNPPLHGSTHTPSHAFRMQPFSSYAPECFQTAPPSSSAAAAELVVIREQLERDIRRHDQLLAAIGKLQKTASEHASRR